MNHHISQEVSSFLSEPNYMVLSTLGRTGFPQLTIVWFHYENGMFKISITKDRVKYKNILRNSRVGCLIYDRNNPYRYLQIKGEAVNIEDDADYVFGDFLCERYGRDENYRFDPIRKKEGRVIISIKPNSFYSKGL